MQDRPERDVRVVRYESLLDFATSDVVGLNIQKEVQSTKKSIYQFSWRLRPSEMQSRRNILKGNLREQEKANYGRNGEKGNRKEVSADCNQ